MATSAPLAPHQFRDASGFGGFVPSTAVARGGETLVAALAVEHHADGLAVPLLVLSGAPGLLEWDPSIGLTVRDDRGERYEGSVLTRASGLGQMTATVWIEPAVPAAARRIELVVDGLARVNPTATGGPGVSRPVGGGPWNLLVDLLPDRTVAPAPPEPANGGTGHTGSVPVRSYDAFIGLIPVGQARLVEGVAVGVLALERYWDRVVASLVALGPPGDDASVPAIGRATIEAWDDVGTRYRVTPVQGAARGSWSEVAAEFVPAPPPDATVMCIRVGEIPRGADGGRRLSIPGPFTFGVRLPAA